MEIHIKEIPDFLRDSEFFNNLNEEETDLITIPYLKLDKEVLSLKDFMDLIETINFFGLRKYPNNFIRFYQYHSKDVFDILNNDEFKNNLLLQDLCNVKIKNPQQFFITYEIINKLFLDPYEYNNYIEYALNNYKKIMNSYSLGKNNYLFDDLFLRLRKTEIIAFVSLVQDDERFEIIFELKKNSNDYYEKLKIIVFSSNRDEFRDNIIHLIYSIEIDGYHSHKYTTNMNIISFKYELPSYYGGIINFCEYKNYDYYDIKSIKINEFNKKIIIEELRKILN